VREQDRITAHLDVGDVITCHGALIHGCAEYVGGIDN